jgi:hypothetical protein
VKAQFQTRERENVGSRAAAQPPTKQFSYTDRLGLNLAPLRFSCEEFEAGRTAYKDEEQYRELREAYQATHAFRYDARDAVIYDIPMADGAAHSAHLSGSRRRIISRSSVRPSITRYSTGLRRAGLS